VVTTVATAAAVRESKTRPAQYTSTRCAIAITSAHARIATMLSQPWNHAIASKA
jgi:hypothetical protein